MSITQEGGLAPSSPPHGSIPGLTTLKTSLAQRRQGALRWLRSNTFVPAWLPRGWRRPAVGYLFGALFMLAATAATWGYGEVFPNSEFGGAFEFVALVLVAVSFGAGPSLLATLLGAAFVYVVLPPQFALSPLNKVADVASLVVFLCAGGVLSLLPSRVERQRLCAARAEAARLADLDRVRTDFIANVSHDLQTPLTSIRAGLGLLDLSAGQRLSPDEQGLLEAARHNADRLRLHIDDLLVATHLEADTLRLDRQPLDLSSVIRSAAATMHPLIAGKAQSLTLDVPEPLPLVCDGRRLEQVLVNLLANAYRHTPPGTQVVVSGRAGAGVIHVWVRDTGPGMPKAALETIFLHFHRLGDEASGTGLGLAIVQALVQRHGGRVWAESAPGAGATFRVELPSAPTDMEDTEDWEEEIDAPYLAHR